MMFSGRKSEANRAKFVWKCLAYATFIHLKIETRNYVKYLRNDIGHRIRETVKRKENGGGGGRHK